MSPRRTLSSAPSECRTLSRQSGFCTTPCVTEIHFLGLDLTNHQYHHHDSSPPCPSLIGITFLRDLVRLASIQPSSESPCWGRWTRPPLSPRRSGGTDFQRAGIQILLSRCCASVVILSSCLLMSEQDFKNFESFWHNLIWYVSEATWW